MYTPRYNNVSFTLSPTGKSHTIKVFLFLNGSVIVVIETDMEFQILPFLPHNREKIVLLNLTSLFNYNITHD